MTDYDATDVWDGVLAQHYRDAQKSEGQVERLQGEQAHDADLLCGKVPAVYVQQHEDERRGQEHQA